MTKPKVNRCSTLIDQGAQTAIMTDFRVNRRPEIIVFNMFNRQPLIVVENCVIDDDEAPRSRLLVLTLFKETF